MGHNIESCDQGGEDQDMTWLDGPFASVSIAPKIASSRDPSTIRSCLDSR